MKQYSMFIEKGASDTDMWTLSQKKEESLFSFNRSFKTLISNIIISYGVGGISTSKCLMARVTLS